VGGKYKICDFGSAIQQPVDYDSLEKREKYAFNEYIELHSTLMYRSPEMIEPSGRVIGQQSDIWMLGCIAYLLTFRKHPFHEQGKLAILTNNPPYPLEGPLPDLVRSMLVVDPLNRPSADSLITIINSRLQ